MSQTLFIERFERGSEHTLSRIRFAGEQFFGIEPKWASNTPFVSCIPDGIYHLVPRESNKHGRHLMFVGGTVGRTKTDVEHPYITRYLCLIHPANYARELVGCLAIGKTQGRDQGVPFVGHSRKALDRLLELLEAFGQKRDTQAIIRWRLAA